jgi:pyrroloquinoline quinone biosynthesis protein D
MISLAFRPLLASKARMRFDRHSGSHMLVYPEKGLLLNATATEVVKLCTGEHSVAQIIAQLQRQFHDAPAEQVEHEVLDFVLALAERGLVRELP